MTRPTLVLLPGLLCDDAVWAEQREALREVDVVVPAYGRLASITAMAEHVLATVDAPRFALAGHSMGGRIAFEIARLAPDRVERLAILDSGVDPLPDGEAGERERRQRFALLATARESGMRAMGREWARGMVHPSRIETEVFDRILDMIERRTPEEFEAQITALLGRPDARPMLAALRGPTCFVVGRQDAWSPPARHEAMHAACLGSRLVLIEDAGHMAPMERPDAVTEALRQWLTT